MSESFGQFIHTLPSENLCIKVEFPTWLVKQKQFWHNSNHSAKFISEYISIFFPVASQSLEQLRQQTEICDAARYITNELLENAFKFSCVYDHALHSGLGFITILINYNTELGWKIEQQSQDADTFFVTTMAQLLYPPYSNCNSQD